MKNLVRVKFVTNSMSALKLPLTGKKLQEMANSDASGRREFTSWGLLECRMADRLETKMFVCRANMPAMYKRDLTCPACTREAENGALGPVEDQPGSLGGLPWL